MTTRSELRELESRPRRYWNVDGIPEMVMGAVWVIWGVAMIGQEMVGRGVLATAYKLVMPALLVLSGVAANRVVRKLKERVTYPRTGYVELPEPGRGTRLATAVVAVVAASALAAMIATGKARGMEQVASPAVGLVISLALLVASVRQRAPHLLALAGVALALGVGFAMLKLGWSSMNWMFVWLGLAAVVAGGWRLRGYLKAHPLEAQA